MERTVVAGCLLVAACTSGPATVQSATSTASSPAVAVEPPATSPSGPDGESPTLSPSPPDASPTSSPTPPPELGAFDPDRALAVAARLAAGGPRPAGSQAEQVARFEIAMALWSAGWTVVEEPFSLPQGGDSSNLVASVGARPDGPHVVIGAHLDTVADSPGANDNGSGIGVLVALAEELADEAADLPVPVVLVAFSAEEYQPSDPRQHHVGSEVHAADPSAQVVAMLSIDMVGNGAPTCICWLAEGPSTLADRLDRVATDHDIAPVERRSAPDWSDHGPFARRGIPAAFLWTGPSPGYHGPGDTPDLLRPSDIDRAGRLVLAFVRSLRVADRDGLG